MELDQLQHVEEKCIKTGVPCINHEKALWLWDLVHEEKPDRILELGTALGYSGLILASTGGHLVTAELNKKEAEEAIFHFEDFDVDASVAICDGVVLVKKFVDEGEEFDFIFIDFQKDRYGAVLEDCVTLLRKGGVLVADNVLNEKCADFLEAVKHHKLLKTEIIKLGDGMSFSRKK